MLTDRQCEFFLLRYVPDAVKEEFVNIGVLLVSGDGAFAEVRFTRDWRRVRCLDPGADVEMLEALEAEIRSRLAQAADRALWLEKMQDWCSNCLQVSSAKACLTDSPAAELGRLAEMYLESNYPGERRGSAGRGLILGRMRDAFQRAGVWESMRKRIPVSQYTEPGDPLTIDCGYRPNGVVRLFQAVPLATAPDAAKVLAFSYPQIRQGIARLENAQSELTAIVEDDLDRSEEAIRFALETFERASILVAASSTLPEIAERARLELRV